MDAHELNVRTLAGDTTVALAYRFKCYSQRAARDFSIMLLMHYEDYDFASRPVAKYAASTTTASQLHRCAYLFSSYPRHTTPAPSHGAFHFSAPSQHLPLANAGHASAILEFVSRQYVAPALSCAVRTPLAAYRSGQRSYRVA